MFGNSVMPNFELGVPGFHMEEPFNEAVEGSEGKTGQLEMGSSMGNREEKC